MCRLRRRLRRSSPPRQSSRSPAYTNNLRAASHRGSSKCKLRAMHNSRGSSSKHSSNNNKPCFLSINRLPTTIPTSERRRVQLWQIRDSRWAHTLVWTLAKAGCFQNQCNTRELIAPQDQSQILSKWLKCNLWREKSSGHQWTKLLQNN